MDGLMPEVYQEQDVGNRLLVRRRQYEVFFDPSDDFPGADSSVKSYRRVSHSGFFDVA